MRRLYNAGSQVFGSLAVGLLALGMLQAIASADPTPGPTPAEKCTSTKGRCYNNSCPAGKGCTSPEDCECSEKDTPTQP